jgi:hypothetical protein
MADWGKKIQKACGSELGGESVVSGLFVQPSGAMASAVARGVGGVVGSMVAEARHKDASSADGTAASIPSKNLVLGLTSSRLVVCGHAAMSGKPKGVEMSFPLSDVSGIDVEPGKISSKLSLAFADGSTKVFDAPKMGKPEEFVAAFAQVKR